MAHYYGSLFHGDIHRIKTLTRSEIMIYSVMVAHGGKKRTVKMSQGKIAAFAGVSLGSCKRALRKFQKLGWIEARSYYQIKMYVLTLQEVDHSHDLGQSNDLGQSHEPCMDQSHEPVEDQHDDLHVISSNKEEHNITCTDKDNSLDWSTDSMMRDALTSEEVIFVQLYTRWSNCKTCRWISKTNPLLIYRKTASAVKGLLNNTLELKVIDSWLLMQREDKTGKHWRGSSWQRGLNSWFKRQVDQGSRSNVNTLSKRQRGFFDYSVSEMAIPEVPDTSLDLDEYRRKKERQEQEQERIDANLCQTERGKTIINWVTEDGKLTVERDNEKIIARLWAAYPRMTAEDKEDISENIDLFNRILWQLDGDWYNHYWQSLQLRDSLAIDKVMYQRWEDENRSAGTLTTEKIHEYLRNQVWKKQRA